MNEKTTRGRLQIYTGKQPATADDEPEGVLIWDQDIQAPTAPRPPRFERFFCWLRRIL